MVDLAPGWQIRCPKCGKTRSYGEVGGVRLGAASRGKRILGWCRRCNWFRWAVVERVPAPVPAVAPAAPVVRRSGFPFRGLLAVVAAVAVGVLGGKLAVASGYGFAFMFILAALVGPVVPCLLARRGRVAVGLLTNLALGATVLINTYQTARSAGDVGAGWSGPLLPGLVLTGLALLFAMAVSAPLARRGRG
jgi:hypothetical protein